MGPPVSFPLCPRVSLRPACLPLCLCVSVCVCVCSRLVSWQKHAKTVFLGVCVCVCFFWFFFREEKRNPNPNFLFGPDGGLPREGVGAKKFGMSFETQANQTFWWDIPSPMLFQKPGHLAAISLEGLCFWPIVGKFSLVSGQFLPLALSLSLSLSCTGYKQEQRRGKARGK